MYAICRLDSRHVFLGKFFGTIGILLAYPAAELLSLSFYLIVALARYRRMKGNSSFEQALLLLPPTEDEIYSLETEICDLDGAIGLSKKTQEFCLSKGIDPKRSHYAALCTEEMWDCFCNGFQKRMKAF